ncbi:hypothetical protein DL769_001050 [Monosporascus sp. CRB-8-3]|nr:hypothetical protein DL769_001050 [Monosporascus sp. CRB-8-3]
MGDVYQQRRLDTGNCESELKSNIGHSGPAAGISGLIKAVLAVERGVIPGNPTFDIPNPNIDFTAAKVMPSKAAISWPRGLVRRASVNSFGYGGSNVHAIVEHPSILLPDYEKKSTTSYAPESNDFWSDEAEDEARRLLVFSANDEISLKAYIKKSIQHFFNPAVNIRSADLAYTLSQRRTRHFYRAYAVSSGRRFVEKDVVYGKLGSSPRVGFVFTGQGAQWPQMARSLIQYFPVAKETIQYLDQTLRSMPEPPSWSLMSELTEARPAEHMRLPEFSQPLVTALQLSLLQVLQDWGVQPSMVVGHSSGEIAAAVAAGLLSQEDGIRVAYFRGKSASAIHITEQNNLGMLAVGLGLKDVQHYLDLYPKVRIACRNSPSSLTLSGQLQDLEGIQAAIKTDGQFARLLMVNLAYHSEYMDGIAAHYRTLLEKHCPGLLSVRGSNNVHFYSTVHGGLWDRVCDSSYWVANMVSPVLFEQGATSMIKDGGADFLVEIGPSGALAGPINQITQLLSQEIASIQYTAALARNDDPAKPLYNLAGKLFVSGGNIDLMKVNGITSGPMPRVIVDLPNYQWTHSVKYWHESLSSKDWRYRPFPVHDLLGTKILDIVFPASAYIAMAVEAMYQTAKCTSMEQLGGIRSISNASYRLRNISTLRDDIWSEHCTGLNLVDIESVPGQRTSRARITQERPDTLAKESQYAIHPSVFDAFFQAGIPSLYQGHRTLIEKALVPQLIDEILINPCTTESSNAIAVTDSTFITGRPDKVENYMSNSHIYDGSSNSLIAKIQGLHYTDLNIPATKGASHTFMRLNWKPDISLLQKSDIQSILDSDYEATALSNRLSLPRAAAYRVSLLKHEMTSPSVLDLNMFGGDQRTSKVDEAVFKTQFPAVRRYVFTSTTPEHLLDVRGRARGVRGAEFRVYDIASSGEAPFDLGAKFDLVILRTSSVDPREVETGLRKAREFLHPSGFLVVVQKTSLSDNMGSGPRSEGANFASWQNEATDSLLRSAGLVARSQTLSEQNNFGDFLSVCLFSAMESYEQEANDISFAVVDWSGGSCECASLIKNLRELGWAGDLLEPSVAVSQSVDIPLLLLDDPKSPLLARVVERDWDDLRRIMVAGRKVLWLTSGSQMQVSSPSNSLIHGFARSLRDENSILDLRTLDVSSFTSAMAAESAVRVMRTLSGRESTLHAIESEYCERGGILHVSRILPDEKIISAAEETERGSELVETRLRENQKTLRMYCERPGSMESLHFNEVAEQDMPLEEGDVEVEIMAAGMNFKDVATTLGIVPENEHLLGLEGAGVITQVGSKVNIYRAGDRVLVHGKGSFANRNRVPHENVFLLPETLSFEEAATMSIAYFTAIFCLMEIAQVRRGRTVLIHSAAGGVGIASIQVCQYLGAEIYATVGNNGKRQFLEEQYGIPQSRIFSSRNTVFATGIRALTKGKGIDCVLNSLTGDLLDESWRLLGDNGTLVEIGKKDIVDRNMLSMEPFNRNCSYRGVDISKPSILDDLPLVERVLQTIRKLYLEGHIKPISPMKIFSFNQIPDAMRYMRSGQHIGKIVISDGTAKDVRVPVRLAPLALKLDPNVAYLIVGGLKGLCGSLALYLARCGARHLTILSRSGAGDERSQRVIRDLSSLGATATISKGDVSKIDDVTRIFQESVLPIKGIIQGAMVLRDKTFESMTIQEYYDALACKFSGTWNLHTAAEQANQKLDFFTMLSSVSGIVGTAGQANYAAGNSFQDAFASYRDRLGLNSHTVDLGIVEDVGYMSEHQSLTDRVQSRSQLSGINERQLHDILKFSILQQTGNGGKGVNQENRGQMITGLPYPLAEESPLLADMRFHSLLVPDAHAPAAVSGGQGGDYDLQAFQLMLKASLPVERLIPEMIKLVNKQVVRVLGLTTDMEESKPLSSYGIDSLAAVDLRNWFKVRLRVRLTTLDILNAGNLRSLCAKVVDQIVDNEKREK